MLTITLSDDDHLPTHPLHLHQGTTSKQDQNDRSEGSPIRSWQASSPHVETSSSNTSRRWGVQIGPELPLLARRLDGALGVGGIGWAVATLLGCESPERLVARSR